MVFFDYARRKMLPSTDALLRRLEVIHAVMTFIWGHTDTRVEKLMLRYKVWDRIERHLNKIRRIIHRIESNAVFDHTYGRFSTELEVAYNAVIAEFADSRERETYWYHVGEIPDGRIEHMLNFRRYERISLLPLDLRRIVFGYVAGNVRAMYKALRDMFVANEETNLFYENIMSIHHCHKDVAADLAGLRVDVLGKRLILIKSFLDMAV